MVSKRHHFVIWLHFDQFVYEPMHQFRHVENDLIDFLFISLDNNEYLVKPVSHDPLEGVHDYVCFEHVNKHVFNVCDIEFFVVCVKHKLCRHRILALKPRSIASKSLALLVAL